MSDFDVPYPVFLKSNNKHYEDWVNHYLSFLEEEYDKMQTYPHLKSLSFDYLCKMLYKSCNKKYSAMYAKKVPVIEDY